MFVLLCFPWLFTVPGARGTLNCELQEVLNMGTRMRPRPVNLSQKLRQIRIDLGLSQLELVRRLGFEDSLHVGRISEYESSMREPSLLLLLAYARLARVHLEDIVDDERDLPPKLPGKINRGRGYECVLGFRLSGNGSRGRGGA